MSMMTLGVPVFVNMGAEYFVGEYTCMWDDTRVFG